MRIATEAEIMWTKQRFNELLGGIKFKCALSDTMLKQVPQSIDYTELIW